MEEKEELEDNNGEEERKRMKNKGDEEGMIKERAREGRIRGWARNAEGERLK